MTTAGIDPVVARLLAARPRHDAPPALATLRAPAGRPGNLPRLPSGGPVHDSVVTLAERSLPVRIYGGTRDDCTIVWFHGGGFVKGDLDSQDSQARMVAEVTGRRVVSVDYRLAPEHPFPAAHLDAVDTVRWVGDHLAERVAVAGPSAGANLAVGAALALARTPSAPIAQLLVYPMLGGDEALPSRRQHADAPGLTTRAVHWLTEQYVPDPIDRTDPRFCVLASPHLDRLPPTVLLGAGHDPLRDDARRLGDLLRQHGVRVQQSEEPTLPHGFWKLVDDAPVAHAAAHAACSAFGEVLDSVRPR